MKQKNSKARIVTRKKSYPIQDSVLYKLSNKKRLSEILFCSRSVLRSLQSDEFYRCFTDASSGKPRKIQAPLPRLDRVHSRIASLLCRITPLEALHSGVRGRSNVTNARAHLAEHSKLITVDMKSFFESTNRRHVFNFFFQTMNCAPDIADILSKIITYNGHVPTGSRISMPIAYFANLAMFTQLQQFSDRLGLTFTIYVDDLTFSGKKLNKHHLSSIKRIVDRSGHKLHPRKTRYYGESDIKLVTGAAIHGAELLPRRAHLKNLREDMTEFFSEPEKRSPKGSASWNRAVGRLNYLSSIDRRYRDKARTFRRISAFSKPPCRLHQPED